MRIGRSILVAWVIAAGGAVSISGAEGLPIATRDGLVLELAGDGSVTGVRIGPRNLPAGSVPGGVYLADVAARLQPPAELLRNGGFEDIEADTPVGWSVGSDWTVDARVRRSGRVSMRVRVPGPEKRSSGELAVVLPVAPNALYRASMWMKTRDCAPHFYIVFLDGAGRAHRSHPQIVVSHSRRKSDWFRLDRVFATPPFCRRIRLYVRLWQQTGTAWVDDVSLERLDRDLVAPQRLVRGSVHREDERVVVESVVAESALRVRTVYVTHPEYIEVTGEVEDVSGRDRAVTVSFRLPVNPDGWTWFDDLRHAQQIRPGILYGAARPFGEGRLLGLYPFAATGDANSAIGLAVRMDDPCVFRLCADTDRGVYVAYEFGLSRAAAKFPGRARWRCILYRCDPRWGLRSAAERYYQFFPQFFRKRVEREGGAGFMPSLDRLASDEKPWNAPAFAIYDWHKRQAAPELRREGVRLFSYTEFSGWWGWAVGITPDQAERKPTPEAAWQHIEELAHASPPNRVARCIVNCNPQARDGRPYLHKTYVPQWGGYNYVCNPDPEIEGLGGLLNRYTLTLEREVSKVRTFGLDGMYYDCVFVFETDNFRREHFRWADHPLAFDHVTGRPVLPLAFSIYECAETISNDMHRRGKLVMANYSVTNHNTDIFCIQFVDVVGNEMLGTTPTEPKLMLQRALAYRKTISMSWQEAKNAWPAERTERDMKRAMAWGSFYYLSGMDPKTWREGTRLTQRLAAAGWEPIPYAEASEESCVLERFGRVADGNLHFALHNPDRRGVTCHLRFNASSLGLASRKPVLDLWMCSSPSEYRRVPVTRTASVWTAAVTVRSGDTVVLRFADAWERAGDQLLFIPDLLERAAAFASALKQAGTPVPVMDLAEMTRLVREARTALSERRLRAAQAVFQRMLEVLPGERTPGKPTSREPRLARRWRRRYRECLGEIRQALTCGLACLRDTRG